MTSGTILWFFKQTNHNFLSIYKLIWILTKKGADMVELDVQLSKDKIPLVYHDFDVNIITKTVWIYWYSMLDDFLKLISHRRRRDPTILADLPQMCTQFRSKTSLSNNSRVYRFIINEIFIYDLTNLLLFWLKADACY